MPRKAASIILSEGETVRLQQWLKAGSTPQQVALRSRIVLLAAEGQQDQQISQTLRIQRRTVALWRHRALTQGIGCVWEIASGRGRKPHFKSKEVARIVKATLHTKPQGATHWSTRSLARAQKVSKNTVHRI